MTTRNNQQDLNAFYRSKNREDINLIKNKTSQIKDITIAMNNFLDSEKDSHLKDSKSAFSKSTDILSTSPIKTNNPKKPWKIHSRESALPITA